MYQLQHYLEMMRDPHRMRPLEAALRQVIQPGDVVLDLGTGTGVLSFIALDAGAQHVFAVERSPVIELARKIARANGLADRMTFIQGDARNMTLPRQVDCLVGDVRGTLPLLEDNIDLFEAVRQRWLRPGGRTIPLADELHVAPVCARAPHERVVGWSEPRPEARYDAARPYAANALVRASLAAVDVIAPSQPFGSVLYEGHTPHKLGLRTAFVVERDAAVTGLGVWFRATLAEGISMDTSPLAPATIYAQGFFPLAEAHAVRESEKIRVDLSVHRLAPDPIWTWRVETERAPRWCESHSTFEGAALGLDPLSLLDGSRCPALSDDGSVARAVLESIDGRTPARAVAARLAAAFPERFPSQESALPHVLKLLGLYSMSS
jgi:protein arginine N-methyltransferase 1